MANSLLKELFTPSMEAHDDAEAQVGYGIDSMEHASLEMMEAHEDVISTEQAAEELENIHVGLESIHASLEASLEDGGLDPVAAQFAHHAVEAHVSRLGMEAKDTLPSLEAFGGDTGRQTSTTVSMEATDSTMGKVIEAIRRAIDAIIKAVSDFFSKLFSNAEKLEKAVDATMKKVKDAKGSPQGKTRVPNAESLAYKGSVSASDVAKGLAQTTSTYDVMSGEYLAAATNGQKNLMEALEDGVKEMKDDRGTATKVKDAIVGKLGGEQKSFVQKVEGLKSKAESELSGGMVLSFETDGEGDEKTIDVKLEKPKDAKKLDGNEIDTPSKSDLESVLGEAKKLAKSLIGAKKNVDNAVKVYREIHKIAGDLNKGAKGGAAGKFLADSKAKLAVRSASKNVVQPVQRLANHSWTVVRSSVGFAEASLKNYGDKKDAKKDDE